MIKKQHIGRRRKEETKVSESEGENNFNSHLLPLSFFKDKNGQKRKYIRS